MLPQIIYDCVNIDLNPVTWPKGKSSFFFIPNRDYKKTGNLPIFRKFNMRINTSTDDRFTIKLKFYIISLEIKKYYLNFALII